MRWILWSLVAKVGEVKSCLAGSKKNFETPFTKSTKINNNRLQTCKRLPLTKHDLLLSFITNVQNNWTTYFSLYLRCAQCRYYFTILTHLFLVLRFLIITNITIMIKFIISNANTQIILQINSSHTFKRIQNTQMLNGWFTLPTPPQATVEVEGWNSDVIYTCRVSDLTQ